jgi:hypothetical protein
MALRAGKILRLIINMPPRYLKSLLASIAAFPAWCLGNDSGAQIVCVIAGLTTSVRRERSPGSGAHRQIVARLPADPRQRLVPADLASGLSPERQAVSSAGPDQHPDRAGGSTPLC